MTIHDTPEIAAARERVEQNGWRPKNCVWELTLACNLRCGHCGSRAGHARPDELSTAECLQVVGDLDALGCELVTLSGGEPTLRRDWDRIARAVADAGIKVNMVTNGVYRSRDAAREVATRARDAGLCNVGLSVDGPQAVHDRIRGVGTYARVMDSVADFRAAGVPVGIMTTVSQLNVDHLAAVRQAAIDAGAVTWRLQLGKPMGNLADQADWVIPPARLIDLIPRLAAFKREGGIHLAVGDSLGYYGPTDRVLRGWGWRGRKEVWRGCQAGMLAVGIEADGGVKGCLSLQAKDGAHDPFVEGNVRRTRLLDLWFAPGVFAYNRDYSRSQLQGFCASCHHADACRGGARCVTSAVGEGLWNDPYCLYLCRARALHAGKDACLPSEMRGGPRGPFSPHRTQENSATTRRSQGTLGAVSPLYRDQRLTGKFQVSLTPGGPAGS
jgi:radical SAM protein with 4Fe4S-binding SPASM domain